MLEKIAGINEEGRDQLNLYIKKFINHDRKQKTYKLTEHHEERSNAYGMQICMEQQYSMIEGTTQEGEGRGMISKGRWKIRAQNAGNLVDNLMNASCKCNLTNEVETCNEESHLKRGR